MANFKPWEPVGKNTIAVVGGPTKNPKKVTGTRLGAILGANKYKTEFEAWCEITRVGEQPFEGNKFTEAGSAIEPALIEFCKTEVSPYIVTPREWFGKTTQEMGYDHFPDQPIFGGMWDALVLDAPFKKGGKPLGVVEAKTSSRPQDWLEGVPASYAIQGVSYAWLMGVDRVFFPVRFMEPGDYEAPEKCECTEDNTVVYELRVSEWLWGNNSIDSLMTNAQGWYDGHVVGNESPAFDPKKDADILKVIRKSEVKSDSLEALAKKAVVLEAKIEAAKEKAGLAALEKELKALKEKQLKPAMVELFKQPKYAKQETIVAYGWSVKKGSESYIDKEAMEQDNVLEKYTKERDKFTMTKEKSNG